MGMIDNYPSFPLVRILMVVSVMAAKRNVLSEEEKRSKDEGKTFIRDVRWMEGGVTFLAGVFVICAAS